MIELAHVLGLYRFHLAPLATSASCEEHTGIERVGTFLPIQKAMTILITASAKKQIVKRRLQNLPPLKRLALPRGTTEVVIRA